MSAAISGAEPAYRPIAEHAAIGDGRSCALTDGRGGIDWLAWPRFDSEPLLAAILDPKAGSFDVRPLGRHDVHSRYVAGTNVCVTTFDAPSGTLELVDFMPLERDGGQASRLEPEHELLRIVACTRGTARVRVVFDPRPRLKRAKVKDRGKLGILVEDGASAYALRGSVPFRARNIGGFEADVELAAGQRFVLSLSFAREAPLVLRSLDDFGAAALESTVAWWRAWSSRARYDGPYRDLVVRSALALKLLCYAPSGAIIAAPTTSLPELPQSAWNWDYRFCWLRDAALTSRALFGLGYVEEARAFVDWLAHATRLTRPALRVLYDVFGEKPPRERSRWDLRGHLESRPVRFGNAAAEQVQLDVYGEVIDAIVQAWRHEQCSDPETASIVRELAEYACKHWNEPDEGIWEIREGRRHHVHSRMSCWVALDRALEMPERVRLSSDMRARFVENRALLAEQIRTRGYNERLGAYVSTLDGDELDASGLLLSWYGFEEASSERMRSTARAIDSVLGLEGGLVRRSLAIPDAGSFAACSFWAVEQLARGGGTIDEARARFEAVARFATPLGLFGEIIEPQTGAALGNFPQGFSHLALINAALSIEERR